MCGTKISHDYHQTKANKPGTRVTKSDLTQQDGQCNPGSICSHILNINDRIREAGSEFYFVILVLRV